MKKLIFISLLLIVPVFAQEAAASVPEISGLFADFMALFGVDKGKFLGVWGNIAAVVGTIMGVLYLIAALDPTNKMVGVLDKINTVLKLLSLSKYKEKK